MTPARIPTLDLARGAAVLFMVMVHVLENYATPAVGASTFGAVVTFLGGPPAAPVFMFLMGASLAFSRRTTIAQGVRRGAGLLLLGYLLNLLRGTAPLALGLTWGLVRPEEVQPLAPAPLFWLVDILQFAGLALILLTVLRRVSPVPTAWLILAGIVALLSPLLWGRMTDLPLLNRLLDLVWSANPANSEWVAFPLFPWLCYPLVGMAFGRRLATSEDVAALFWGSFKVGVGLLLGGTLVVLTDPGFHIGDYARSGPGGVLWMTGFALVWVAACHGLIRRVPDNGIFRLLSAWSRRVTSFYFIHWLVIGWGALLIGYKTQSLPAIVALMVAVAALADLGTRAGARWTRRQELRRAPT